MSRPTRRFFQLALYFSLIALLTSCGYFSCDPDDQDKAIKTDIPVTKEVMPSIEMCRGEAREVLKKYCGKCHLKSISKRPRALAIYTLEDDIWYRNLTKSNLKGITRRIRKWDGPTDEEVNIVLGCVSCLEAETCR